MAGAGWQTYATGDLIDATTFQTFMERPSYGVMLIVLLEIQLYL